MCFDIFPCQLPVGLRLLMLAQLIEWSKNGIISVTQIIERRILPVLPSV